MKNNKYLLGTNWGSLKGNPSASVYINAVELLPCCIIAELFYEETLTPFPGDKGRLSLQRMVNHVWIHKYFKVLT